MLLTELCQLGVEANSALRRRYLGTPLASIIANNDANMVKYGIG